MPSWRRWVIGPNSSEVFQHGEADPQYGIESILMIVKVNARFGVCCSQCKHIFNFSQNPADRAVMDSAFGQLIDQSNIRWKHKRDMGTGDGGILQLVHCMLVGRVPFGISYVRIPHPKTHLDILD